MRQIDGEKTKITEAKADEPERRADESPDEDETDTLNVPQGPVKHDPVVSDSSESASADDDEEADEGRDVPKPKAGQLTAGRWRDLDHWDFWDDLYDRQSEDDPQGESKWRKFEKAWRFHTRRRIGVRVTRGDDKPAVDAEVELRDGDGDVLWRSRTDNRGRAEVFDGLFDGSTHGDLNLVARSGNHQVGESVGGTTPGNRVELQLPATTEPPLALDLMFVVDTTGSMGDELEYVQSELGDVVRRSQQYFGGRLSIRTSVNLYRDTSDDYVVRSHPFRQSYEQAVEDIESEDASGGGNFPEAVDQAVADAVENHEWRDRATARLMFLVLDAPPHQEDEDIERLQSAIALAAEKGIRVIPVTGSGIDKSSEFLLRSLAISTGGEYTFLTDDSGIGGSHIEPTIGQHDVHYLNDLLVTIIHDYTKGAR